MSDPFPKLPLIAFQQDKSSLYTGGYRNGLFHGQGLLITNQGKVRLEGRFANGDFVTGKLTLEDGSTFEGNFMLNMGQEEGTYTKNNFILKCRWNDGRIKESNTCISFENGDIFEGKWTKLIKYLEGTLKQLKSTGEYEEVDINFNQPIHMVMREGVIFNHFSEEYKIASL